MKRQNHQPVTGLLLAIALAGIATSSLPGSGEAAAGAPAAIVVHDWGTAAAPDPAPRGFEITLGIDGERLAWLGIVAWRDGRRSADLLGGVRIPDPLGDLHRGIVVTRVATRLARRWLERLLEHQG